MGFVAPALPAIGAAIGIGGKIAGGIAAGATGDYKARLAKRQALLELESATRASEVEHRAGQKAVGAAAARAGASGFTLTGSAGDVMAQLAQEASQRAASIRYQGQLTATNTRLQGKLDRRQGKIAKLKGFLGAGATLVSAAGDGAFKFKAG